MPLVWHANHLITKRYDFESAHFLPRVPEGHRCKRLHGHGYAIEITLAGVPGEDGLIMDFWDLDKIVQPIIDSVDHRCLNDIAGLENPTAELISGWFWEKIETILDHPEAPYHLHEIKVYETPTCCAILRKA